MQSREGAIMATADRPVRGTLRTLVESVNGAIVEVGDLCLFGLRVLAWLFGRPGKGTLLPVFYAVGVRSVPVVAITGTFIGMVLAVQTYSQFHAYGIDTQLGSMINTSVVSELGPVLAATMLAGRVGSSMAAELATMRITEQIDALTCLGVNPVQYLAVPRFLACVLLIPLLTIMANFMGVLGGAVICVQVYHIDGYHYWRNAQGVMSLWDVGTGLLKPTVFGAAIAVISCRQGFRGEAGAEGVGRAATSAFVASFIAILALDFFLATFLIWLHNVIWPNGAAHILPSQVR
jgi:phospholipid/cholesterol/gamma-HCH transport system permease protein